jgi:hypothetical protein
LTATCRGKRTRAFYEQALQHAVNMGWVGPPRKSRK